MRNLVVDTILIPLKEIHPSDTCLRVFFIKIDKRFGYLFTYLSLFLNKTHFKLAKWEYNTNKDTKTKSLNTEMEHILNGI